MQGAQAHAAGVLFPSDDDTLHRTILIANINPLINTEQVNPCSYLTDSCLSWSPCKILLLLLICSPPLMCSCFHAADVQVKQLFGFCGQVKSCRMVGNNQFAFVEYSSAGVSHLSTTTLQKLAKPTRRSEIQPLNPQIYLKIYCFLCHTCYL